MHSSPGWTKPHPFTSTRLNAHASRCEAPSAPPLGELLSEREAEGVRYEIWEHCKICTTPPLRLAKCRLRRLLACIAPAGVSVSPFGLPAFNSGMIATGNHNFERFAALCNTLSGAPRALRAEWRLPFNRVLAKIRGCGRLVAAPTVAFCKPGACAIYLAYPHSKGVHGKNYMQIFYCYHPHFSL